MIYMIFKRGECQSLCKPSNGCKIKLLSLEVLFYGKRRRNESPERQALYEMMNGYLKENPVKNGTDVNGLMREIISVILEGSLDGEMEEELGYSKYDFRNKETDNSRNGYSSKTLHTSYGDMELDVPRDRNGEFESKIIKKYQNTLTQDMEEKIISMYAKGMTTGDIESHMQELYGVDISDSTISSWRYYLYYTIRIQAIGGDFKIVLVANNYQYMGDAPPQLLGGIRSGHPHMQSEYPGFHDFSNRL